MTSVQWLSHQRLGHDFTSWPSLPIGPRPLCLSLSNSWMKAWHPICDNPLLALNGNGLALDRCHFIVWSKSQVQWLFTLAAGHDLISCHFYQYHNYHKQGSIVWRTMVYRIIQFASFNTNINTFCCYELEFAVLVNTFILMTRWLHISYHLHVYNGLKFQKRSHQRWNLWFQHLFLSVRCQKSFQWNTFFRGIPELSENILLIILKMKNEKNCQ